MGRVMQAGLLRHRITLQSKSVTRDAFGGEVVTWGTVATVWAEADPWHMREKLALRREQGQASISFRVRTPLALSLDKSVLFGGVRYDIVEIDVTRKHLGELMLVAIGEDISA